MYGYTKDADIEIVEVVWSGTMAREGTAKINIVGDRLSKPGVDWIPPTRLYNKTGRHKRKVDNSSDGAENGDSLVKIDTFGEGA